MGSAGRACGNGQCEAPRQTSREGNPGSGESIRSSVRSFVRILTSNGDDSVVNATAGSFLLHPIENGAGSSHAHARIPCHMYLRNTHVKTRSDVCPLSSYPTNGGKLWLCRCDSKIARWEVSIPCRMSTNGEFYRSCGTWCADIGDFVWERGIGVRIGVRSWRTWCLRTRAAVAMMCSSVVVVFFFCWFCGVVFVGGLGVGRRQLRDDRP